MVFGIFVSDSRNEYWIMLVLCYHAYSNVEKIHSKRLSKTYDLNLTATTSFLSMQVNTFFALQVVRQFKERVQRSLHVAEPGSVFRAHFLEFNVYWREATSYLALV